MVILIGFYLKKYASTGEDFFMAGRKMTAWIAGLSFISANLSSLETMGWSAMAYQYGMLGAHAYLIGAIPAILFLAVVMMPFYYICKTHSVPGYLKLRYGEASRSLAGISFTFMTVLVCGVNMFAMAKVMQIMLGWNIHFSIWVSSITVAVYVALGGLLSAVFNEVLQFFLIWLGTLLIPILGIIEAGGWKKMIATINAQHPGQNFTSLWAQPGIGGGQSHGHALDRHGVRPGPGRILRLLVHRLPAGPARHGGQEPAVRPERHDHRRCSENDGAADRHHSRIAGLAILTQKAGITLVPEHVRRATGGHSYNEVLAADDVALPGTGPAGAGRHRHDCRIHVGHGRQRQRFRHGVDLRRLPPADQQKGQRRALRQHGTLVLHHRRLYRHRHGLRSPCCSATSWSTSRCW